MIKIDFNEEDVKEKHLLCLLPIVYDRVLSLIDLIIVIEKKSKSNFKGAQDRIGGNALKPIIKSLVNSNLRNRITIQNSFDSLSKSQNIDPFIWLNKTEIQSLFQFLSDKDLIKSILVEKSDVLEGIYETLRTEFSIINHASVIKIIKSIFNYDSFRSNPSWNCQNLRSEYDIKRCPYCNMDHLHSQGDAMDHFIDHSNNPLLGLSLFNLVPSCNHCNSILKRSTQFSVHEYLHPLHEVHYDSYEFKMFPVNGNSFSRIPADYTIDYESTSNNAKVDRSLTLFEIISRYELHKDSELQKLAMTIPEAINREYIYDRVSLIKNSGSTLNAKDIYLDILGKPMDRSEFKNYQLSKLTHDVAIQYGIIDLIEKAINSDSSNTPQQ